MKGQRKPEAADIKKDEKTRNEQFIRKGLIQRQKQLERLVPFSGWKKTVRKRKAA